MTTYQQEMMRERCEIRPIKRFNKTPNKELGKRRQCRLKADYSIAAPFSPLTPIFPFETRTGVGKTMAKRVKMSSLMGARLRAHLAKVRKKFDN